LIGFIIFGFVVGLIARLIMPGRQYMSLPKTTLLGIVGALIAGWLGRLVGWYGPDDSAGFISSTVGAIILLYIYHVYSKARAKNIRESTDRNYPRKVA